MVRKTSSSTVMRWHSRVGVWLFWLLILLSLTGIALNHTDRLGLAKISLTHTALLNWYGLDAAPAVEHSLHGRHYQLETTVSGEQWIGTLYSDGRAVAPCPPPLLGAVELAGQLPFGAVLCRDELLLITAEGQLVDSWQPVAGLPSGLVTLEAGEQLVGRHSDGRGWALNTDQFIATAVAAGAPQAAPAHRAATGVSLQTLLLDLHSGRLFGPLGIWVVDIAGILFCLLALTGLWSFIRRPR